MSAILKIDIRGTSVSCYRIAITLATMVGSLFYVYAPPYTLLSTTHLAEHGGCPVKGVVAVSHHDKALSEVASTPYQHNT